LLGPVKVCSSKDVGALAAENDRYDELAVKRSSTNAENEKALIGPAAGRPLAAIAEPAIASREYSEAASDKPLIVSSRLSLLKTVA